MKLLHLVHLLSCLELARAASTEGSSYPSIFENPTIPIADPSSLGDLPELSHARRAAAAAQKSYLNLTTCDITMEGNKGWSFKPETRVGKLYLVPGVASPGTKNGDNPYDFTVQIGFMSFSTNAYMSRFPYKVGPNVTDYARVSQTSTGSIVAWVDYSNMDNPSATPLWFMSQMRIDNSWDYQPLTTYVMNSKSFFSVNVGDKGVLEGGTWLESDFKNAQRGSYNARISGRCSNFRMSI
ncbi:hypothetical protein NW768_005019 [Fusarium equiseti]|uniref:Uncharacterized protein n=1 Tax=Fusarium equiseti TaxID=61235 RepID=A0ABQ8RE29_FUSEQ|nr:hypothetical protein NW768_005019 [Fusarium equiseti]